jgi:hypothetical protein
MPMALPRWLAAWSASLLVTPVAHQAHGVQEGQQAAVTPVTDINNTAVVASTIH